LFSEAPPPEEEVEDVNLPEDQVFLEPKVSFYLLFLIDFLFHFELKKKTLGCI